MTRKLHTTSKRGPQKKYAIAMACNKNCVQK